MLLAQLTGRAFSRRTIGARLKVNIPQTALTTLGNQHAFAVVIEVGNKFFSRLIPNQSTDWNAELHVVATFAVAIRTTSVFALLGAKHPGVTEVDQSVEIAISDGVNAAAATTITAIGTTEWNVLLTAKRRRSIASVTGNNFNSCFVKEFHELKK
jgi:hypothetical protein